MDLSPVSNREFLAFVQAHPQWKKSQMASDKHDGDYLKHWQGDDRIPAGELDEPVRYVSYCAAAAYCKEQGAYLPSLNQYRVASSERVAFRQIDYETSYSAPAFHFMQTEWTNTWWPSSGPRDPGKRVPYMHGSCHGYQRGDRCYTPEQENRYTGRSLGFRCAQDESSRLLKEGRELLKQQVYDQAIVALRQSADLGNAQAQNSLAWFYATAKDAQFHNGKAAVEYASRAVAQSPDRWSYVDTLAAAYARNGQFSDAVHKQARAIALLREERWFSEQEKAIKLKDTAVRLELYQQNKAYTAQ